MAEKRYPLAIVLETIDKSTKTIRAINERFGVIGQTVDRLRTKFQAMDKEAGLSKALEGVKKTGKQLAVFGAVAGGVIYKLVRGFTEQGNAIADASERLGVGVEWLQKMRHAGERNQLTIEETDGALDAFSKRVGETAAGVGKAKDIFDAWGLSVFDSHGKVKTMEALLPEVADKLKLVENANVRNAVASRLFGDSGARLALALKDGSGGLQDYFTEAEKLGILTEKQVADSHAFEERMLELRKAFEGIRAVLVGPLVPALTEFLLTLTKFLSENREGIAAFGRALAWMAGLWASLKILQLLWGLVLVVKSLALMFVALGSAVGWPVLLVVAGVAAMIAAGAYLMKHWEGIKQWWDGIWNGIGATVFNMVARISGAWNSLKSGNFSGAMTSAFGAGPEAVAAAGSNGTTNTNNAAVRVDINGLGPKDSVSSSADKGMPFSINQGYTLAGGF